MPTPSMKLLFTRGRLRGFLLQDVAGTLVSVLLGTVAHALTGRLDAVVLAAVVGENVGFYGVAWLRVRASLERTAALRHVVDEYLVAEAVDTFAVRPVAIGLTTWSLDSAALGILAGGYLADVVFYLVAGLRTGPRVSRRACRAGPI